MNVFHLFIQEHLNAVGEATELLCLSKENEAEEV